MNVSDLVVHKVNNRKLKVENILSQASLPWEEVTLFLENTAGISGKIEDGFRIDESCVCWI